LNKNPNPRWFSIFFSKAQKNLNWPKRSPINTNKTWYSGKIISNLAGVCQKPKSSFIIPNQRHTGFDNQADVEPVIAKTISIIASCELDSMPQRFFNAFISICDYYKCSDIIWQEHSQKVFVCWYFESKPNNYILNN
jgi:hypothetical protein